MVFPVFKPDFYIFFYNEQLRKILKNFMDKFLLYDTSLNENYLHYDQYDVAHVCIKFLLP